MDSPKGGGGHDSCLDCGGWGPERRGTLRSQRCLSSLHSILFACLSFRIFTHAKCAYIYCMHSYMNECMQTSLYAYSTCSRACLLIAVVLSCMHVSVHDEKSYPKSDHKMEWPLGFEAILKDALGHESKDQLCWVSDEINLEPYKTFRDTVSLYNFLLDNDNYIYINSVYIIQTILGKWVNIVVFRYLFYLIFTIR